MEAITIALTGVKAEEYISLLSKGVQSSHYLDAKVIELTDELNDAKETIQTMTVNWNDQANTLYETDLKLETLQKDYDEMLLNAQGVGAAYVKLRAEHDLLTEAEMPPAPTERVLHDTELAEGLNTKSESPFKKKIAEAKVVHEPSKSRSKWNIWEEKIVQWRINPDSIAAASERTMENLQLKLPGRSKAAIRFKLHSYGYGIKDGKIYKKD